MNQSPVRVNSVGQPIYELDHTEKMTYAWLRDLQWPRDKAVIRHLSIQDFKAWLYGMNPRDALILTNDKDFKLIVNRKQSRFFNWIDAIWRWRHGYC